MQALILAGGSGTRFWPLSRRARPKQLLALDGDRSLLQATVDRLAPLVPPSSVWVCTTALLVDAIREQLPEVPAAQILVEPEGRNTAPAIGYAVRSMPAEVRGGIVAVLPADHKVEDTEAFRSTLANAATVAADDGRVMTLGVTPRWAETGYGYLALGPELPGCENLRQVAEFKEKPDAATAERYAAGGNHLWNAGIFVFRGQVLLDTLARLQPEIASGLEAIAQAPERTAALYPKLPRISIDFAVMEHLDDLGTLPLDCGWSDLGSWEALADHLPGDGDGNALRGDAVAIDARDNLVVADAGHVALVGVEGLVVVRTADSVLVAPKGRSQDVRKIVAALEAGQRADLL